MPGRRAPAGELSLMSTVLLRSVVTSRPGWVIALWAGAAVVVGVCAPDLSKLAALGQGTYLEKEAESLRAGEALRVAWPEQAYESLASRPSSARRGPGGRPRLCEAAGKRGSRNRIIRRPYCRVLGPASTAGGGAETLERGRNGGAGGGDPFDLVCCAGDP